MAPADTTRRAPPDTTRRAPADTTRRRWIPTDTLRRVMEYLGYEVRHVMNVTDVGHLTSDEDTGEDKLDQEARREGKKPEEIDAALDRMGVKSNYVRGMRVTDQETLDIVEMVLVGNTTMTHLFLGLPPASIRLAP